MTHEQPCSDDIQVEGNAAHVTLQVDSWVYAKFVR